MILPCSIPVYEVSAESWINEVRGELAHAGSVVGPGSPVANNLRLSPSTQCHSVPLHHCILALSIFYSDNNSSSFPLNSLYFPTFCCVGPFGFVIMRIYIDDSISSKLTFRRWSIFSKYAQVAPDHDS